MTRPLTPGRALDRLMKAEQQAGERIEAELSLAETKIVAKHKARLAELFRKTAAQLDHDDRRRLVRMLADGDQAKMVELDALLESEVADGE